MIYCLIENKYTSASNVDKNNDNTRQKYRHTDTDMPHTEKKNFQNTYYISF